MKERNPYARPAVMDRMSWIDRLLWTREQHPAIERFLIAFVFSCFAVTVVHALVLSVAQHAHDVVP